MEGTTKSMDDKTKSIIAHLTIIGWIIALVLNQNDKGANTSFYLRQTLGIYLFFILGGLIGLFHIPFMVMLWYFLVFILWVLSILGALGGTQKEVPVVGDMFQQWFKGVL